MTLLLAENDEHLRTAAEEVSVYSEGYSKQGC